MELKSVYGHKINQLGRLFTKNLNVLLSAHGLHTSQWSMILYLHNRQGCTQVELAHYLNVEAPTVTRTLARLEDHGFIKREEGRDKREKWITLTEEAEAIFSKCYEASKNVESKALEGISPEELEIFNRIIEKMNENLNA